MSQGLVIRFCRCKHRWKLTHGPDKNPWFLATNMDKDVVTHQKYLVSVAHKHQQTCPEVLLKIPSFVATNTPGDVPTSGQTKPDLTPQTWQEIFLRSC